MKKGIFILLLFASGWLQAQDSIYLVSNKAIAAKIIEVNAENLGYKKPNYLDGPTYYEKKTNILRVRYSNGDIEFYEETENFGGSGGDGKSAAVLNVDKGEKAVIMLLSEKTIPCEILDISNLCVVYKEKEDDATPLVFMKSSIDRIWKEDSSYLTFDKEGVASLHPKPAAKPQGVVGEPEPDPTPKTPEPVKPDPSPQPNNTPSSAKDKKESKGNCQLITNTGDFIDARDVQVNRSKKTITYIDQFNNVTTKTFKEVNVIKCPPNFISENLLEE